MLAGDGMVEANIIYSAQYWPTNSHLIADCARLGYIKGLTLDATYGLGNFWKVVRPEKLVSVDRYTPADLSADFTQLPFADKTFETVVFDPPYKLNGTSYERGDKRYGVDKPMTWQNRLRLMLAGMKECNRVLAKKGFLLMKCQDQVAWGPRRWQTDMFSNEGYVMGLRKVDRFEFLHIPRKQSEPQRTSRSNYSTLLVFRKP